MIQSIGKIEKISGTLSLPGDKSISHRAVLFSAMADGKSSVTNLLDSEDVNSSIDCMKNLGAEIERKGNDLIITGRGKGNFKKPDGTLYAGNSGTTARLMSGILAAQKFESEIEGDESLSKRPMGRIAEPLGLMGASITTNNGCLPMRIFPSQLNAIEYELPVASAQVKSAALLAGVHLKETTKIIEPVQCRNHTELMLNLPVSKSENGNVIEINESFFPEPKQYIVPADISTAAFFIVLTLISEESELIIKNVLLNKTRAGIIDLLKMMKADIEILEFNELAGENVGDIRVKSSELKNVSIPAELTPNLIDEIPILSVAGLFAEGDFIIRNASELRAKESDRIKSLVENYRKLDIGVEEFHDGFCLSGKVNTSLSVLFNSFGDHRIAMAFSVLSSQLKYGGKVDGFECVSISNPGFLKQLESIS